MNKEVIRIESAVQIIDRLSKDGCLKENTTWTTAGIVEGELETFEVYSDDDLGFYQVACEFLIQYLASRDNIKEREIAKLRSDLEAAQQENAILNRMLNHALHDMEALPFGFDGRKYSAQILRARYRNRANLDDAMKEIRGDAMPSCPHSSEPCPHTINLPCDVCLRRHNKEQGE